LAFEAWRVFAVASFDARRHEGAAFALWRRTRLASAWRWWQEGVQQQKSERAAVATGTSLSALRMKRTAFMLWQSTVRRRRRQRQSAAAALRHHDNALRRMCIRLWHGQVANERGGCCAL